MTAQLNPTFETLVAAVASTARGALAPKLIGNAERNAPRTRKSINDIQQPTGRKRERVIVVSAGPSLARRQSIRRIRDAKFDGTVVAIDASYSACLREGLIPDYVLTMDSHPTRIIRWFGDRQYLENSKNDNYFERQDLDVEASRNAQARNLETIQLVDKHGPRTKLCMSSSAPDNVVQRVHEVGFDVYWWNPLTDDPGTPNSLTRRLYSINGLPCMNTGGNVGTAAWVFAHAYLRAQKIAVVGMDMGYYPETPHNKTQLYFEYANHLGGSLDKVHECFMPVFNPFDGVTYYTDPTYYSYSRAFLQLLAKTDGASKTVNCTEGGTLVDPAIPAVSLDAFFREEC